MPAEQPSLPAAGGLNVRSSELLVLGVTAGQHGIQTSTMSLLRLLPPRATLQLHSRQLQHRLLFPSLRHSSTSPPPKPRVLEKPERFNPPSHPSRLRSRGPKYYGPALSDREREMQKTKRYPHMMPPEGSFMHWFLTDRTIHLWITIVRTTTPQLMPNPY